MKILITSSSFLETPGAHQEALKKIPAQFETLKGPLKEKDLLDIIEKYDALICGDDELNDRVIQNAKNLKMISKYGVGLDKINLNACLKHSIVVKNCINLNHDTVAEHFFALILCFYKNIVEQVSANRRSQWPRITGLELKNKNLTILGMGRIGRSIAKKALAFDMNVIGFDLKTDDKYSKETKIQIKTNILDAVINADIISLNLPLNETTNEIINFDLISHFNKKPVIVNTARGGLVSVTDLIKALESKVVSGYLTDVLDEEPMIKDHPLVNFKNVMITSHTGSRTYENVEKQGLMAVQNLADHFGFNIS